MFGPETFAWFTGLEADNSKAYFAAHRDVYDVAVRGALAELLEDLASELGGEVKLFRQQRDTRFSKDKSPYKTVTYGVIHGRPQTAASLYAQLSASGLFAGTGYYGMAGDQLARFREAVAADWPGDQLARVLDAIHGAGIETWGEALKTAPRGYAKDHPRVRLLRHKMLIAGRRLAPDGATGAVSAADAASFTRATWEVIAPMTAWLDTHVGPSTLPPPSSRYGR
ncbi:MAG TPA: DUF2461 domain-containing protein [Baekduia sp.]|nr:DUF2461 domain-containing protein [Baekduia sp.]